VAGGKSDIGYLMEWTEFNSPAVLYHLQSAGLVTKVATNTFQMSSDGGPKQYGYGTILIPVSMQTQNSQQVYDAVKAAAEKYGVNVQAITTGGVLQGSDLGSSRFPALTKPSVAMVVGTGVNPLDAGEIWHLLDQRFDIPATHLDVTSFNRADLDKYNTLIMVSGTAYNEINKEKLQSWIQDGGTLILTEEAVQWAAQAGISRVELKRRRSPLDSAKSLPYALRSEITGAQGMSGAIFRAEADLTHPLAYGYTNPSVSLFKANSVFMQRSKNPFASPFLLQRQTAGKRMAEP
jgi:hypothetical protein